MSDNLDEAVSLSQNITEAIERDLKEKHFIAPDDLAAIRVQNTLENAQKIYSLEDAFFEIDNISRKVLSDQLKELAEDNLVIRKQFNEIPPRVEYSLTEKGKSLCDVFKSIDKWMNVK